MWVIAEGGGFGEGPQVTKDGALNEIETFDSHSSLLGMRGRFGIFDGDFGLPAYCFLIKKWKKTMSLAYLMVISAINLNTKILIFKLPPNSNYKK